MTEDIEIWVGFPGWDDRYDISSHGRLRGYVWGWKKLSPPRLVKTVKDKKTGYHKIMLHRGKQMLSSTIHKWVVMAFKGPPPNPKMEVCHNDGNKDNNRLSNLRWDTKKNNKADMIKHGTAQRGENSGVAKLTHPQVLSIREKYKAGIGYKQLATEFKCCTTSIWNIINRITWKHI